MNNSTDPDFHGMKYRLSDMKKKKNKHLQPKTLHHHICQIIYPKISAEEFQYFSNKAEKSKEDSNMQVAKLVRINNLQN